MERTKSRKAFLDSGEFGARIPAEVFPSHPALYGKETEKATACTASFPSYDGASVHILASSSFRETDHRLSFGCRTGRAQGSLGYSPEPAIPASESAARISTQGTQEARPTKNSRKDHPSCRDPALCPGPYLGGTWESSQA